MSSPARVVCISVVILVALTAASWAATTEEIVAKCSPSVVFVKLLDLQGNQVASGSGFVVGPELVATCYHVVAGGASAQVKTADSILYPVAAAVAADRGRDLALLRVTNLVGVAALELTDSVAVKAGQRVIAIGSPLGLEGSISEGVVSGLRELDRYGEVLQVSAPVSPGSSGGPLVDEEGGVVGVCAFTRLGGQNLNFGIPANALKDLMSRPAGEPAETGQLLKGFGVLPEKTRTLNVTVPQRAPHTANLPSYHEYNMDKMTVRIGNRSLERVTSEQQLGPGKVYVSTLGVLKFDASAKGQTAAVEVSYYPGRIAVLVAPGEREGTRQDLVAILQEAFAKLGEEVVCGAEVDAAVNDWRKRTGFGMDMPTVPGMPWEPPDPGQVRELGALLDCAKLLVAVVQVADVDMKLYGYYAYATLYVAMVDLNSGRVPFAEGVSCRASGSVFRKNRDVRAEALQRGLRNILKHMDLD